MHIQTIKVKRFKAFRNLELTNLPEIAIFIGANGTGKSTLFDVFGFLGDALRNNVKSAIVSRGGWKEVVTRGSDGPLEFELQFSLKIDSKIRLVTYILKIGLEKGQPIVKQEIIRYKRGRYGAPYKFLDFANGEGFAITNEEDYDIPDVDLEREHQKLQSPDILAIKGLGQFANFKAASAFRDFIEQWHISDLHISEARATRDAGYAEHLSQSGDNLPLVAQHMFENYPDRFQEVLTRMGHRVPGVSNVSADTTIDGRVVLRFKDGAFNDPFIARYVSDGTIKMFAYLVLLFDPNPHPLLCIEEPENQLYPTLLPELLEEFRGYAHRGGQVFVTTHSPDLLNGAKLSEVFWLVKQNGSTEVRRASEVPEIQQMFEQGEPLGALWKQNYFQDARPK